MSSIKLSPEFEAAAKDFEELVKENKPDDTEKLEGYALYKQGSVGDNTKPKPGLISTFADKAKWNAYEAKKGISPEDAQSQYVEFVKKIKEKYSS